MKTAEKIARKIHDDICFYYLCDSDFEQVITTFELLKTCVKPALRYRLFVFIIITYARAFTKNEGNNNKHTLDKKIIPSEYRDLHNEIMNYRNKIIAHTDVKYRNPHLSKFGMAVKGVYYENYQDLIIHKPVYKMVKIIAGKLLDKVVKAKCELEKYD